MFILGKEASIIRGFISFYKKKRLTSRNIELMILSSDKILEKLSEISDTLDLRRNLKYLLAAGFTVTLQKTPYFERIQVVIRYIFKEYIVPRYDTLPPDLKCPLVGFQICKYIDQRALPEIGAYGKKENVFVEYLDRNGVVSQSYQCTAIAHLIFCDDHVLTDAEIKFYLDLLKICEEYSISQGRMDEFGKIRRGFFRWQV